MSGQPRNRLVGILMQLLVFFRQPYVHFLVLIISYEYHAAKTYFVSYLHDLVLEILHFSWYFGRCSWFFGGCSGFSGECSWFSGGVPDFLGCVPGFRWCSGFFGCSGMFQCSGVPGSTTCPKQVPESCSMSQINDFLPYTSLHVVGSQKLISLVQSTFMKCKKIALSGWSKQWIPWH